MIWIKRLRKTSGRPPHVAVSTARPYSALAASQREALLRLALSSKVLVITGVPGVGKTTLVNSIPRVLAVKGVRTRRRWSRLGEWLGDGHEADRLQTWDTVG